MVEIPDKMANVHIGWSDNMIIYKPLVSLLNTDVCVEQFQ